MSKKKKSPTRESRAPARNFVARIEPHWELFIGLAETQAMAVLREHHRGRWEDVKDTDPETLRMAGQAIYFAELVHEKMKIGDQQEAMIYAFQCGFYAGILPGANKLQAKLSRTKKPIKNRIEDLRKEGYSPRNIAIMLNSMFKKKSGKPYNENDVKQYMRRHSIG